MIVITTHLNADFDCLASIAAAYKLHPEAVIIFPGSQEKNVRDFLEKTGFPLPIRKLKNFDLSQVKKLVIVDTTSRERLGVLASLCKKPEVEIELYDHHPSAIGDILFREGRIVPRGANTTLMVEILKERGIILTPEEATLMMIGIYEDTGSLTFSSTCAEDFSAAEYLLKKGANLNVVSDFLHRNLNAAQIILLHELFNRLEFHTVNGVEIALAIGKAERYVGDLAMVVHALKDMENLAVLFIIVEMEGRLHFIARSRIGAVDASLVAEKFGGGGHGTAASATIRNMLVDDARKSLLKALTEIIPPAPTAERLLVSPVISVKRTDPIKNVEQILTRHNFNAVPVVENEKVAGLITRQIVEKVLYHKLGDAKAEDYMQREIAQVKMDTPYETVRQIIVNKKQKLVPVLDKKGNMAGIIGRMDVMRAIYSDFLKSPSSMLYPHRKTSRPVSRDLSGIIRERLPVEVRELLGKVGDCADEMGYGAYMVGGFVRDLIMRRKNLDVDIVIEGDGIELARRFVEKHGGRVKAHKKFKTAIIVLPDKKKIDMATARTEYYTEPAALPIVEMSSIKNDLYRRDFTTNALAVKLNGKDKNRLIDFFGGQHDLKDGVIRVLHNLSFVEDPTRVFRAIRFEERLHFTLGSQTENLLKLAVRKELINRISGTRLFTELQLIFNEEHVERVTKRIQDFGLWRFLHPAIKYNDEIHDLMEQAKEAIYWHRLTFDNENIRPWLIYFLCLSSKLSQRQTAELFKRLGFNEGPVRKFVEIRAKARQAIGHIDNARPKSPVDVYETFNGYKPETLLIVMAVVHHREAKRTVVEYMTRMRYASPKVKGNDLIKAGIKSGPLLGRIMEVIKRENLKYALPKIEDEIIFARKFYKVLKKNLGEAGNSG